jgi:hypothetical protein
MIAFQSPLKLWTLLMVAQKDDRQFAVSYEIIAADEEQAARLAVADIVARGEHAVDVEHVEIGSPIRDPLASPGVRFRTGRAYFDED